MYGVMVGEMMLGMIIFGEVHVSSASLLAMVCKVCPPPLWDMYDISRDIPASYSMTRCGGKVDSASQVPQDISLPSHTTTCTYMY